MEPMEEKAQPVPSLGKRLIFWAILIAIPLFVQEVLFQTLFPIPEITNFNRMDYSNVFNPKRRASVPKRLSHASFYWTSEPDGQRSVQTLNLYGFRDKNWNIDAKNRERVLFVGDSFVEGFMAPDGQTMVDAFQRAAQEADRDIEAVNLGIGGAQFINYVKLIRDAVPLFRAEHLILVLYGNDLPVPPFKSNWLEKPLAPERSNAWLPRAVQVIATLRAGEPLVTRAIAKPFEYFQPFPSKANLWSRDPIYYSSFVSDEIAAAIRAGTFNPNMINSISNVALRLRGKVEISEHLSALKEYAIQHGTRLHVVYIPYAYQVNSHYIQMASAFNDRKDITDMSGEEWQGHRRYLGELSKRLDIPFLDMMAMLRELESSGTRCYWGYDDHFTPEVYQRAGQRIYAWFSGQAETQLALE